ncbi:MAG: FAD-dependent 5-carboxymethylaminomethyl-2-thiouridine(34) oxidoreductase MnmC [Variovorax sp.]
MTASSLAGCGLPGAWAGQHQWRILDTDFGLGLEFLTTWKAWRTDPRRPRLLHFVSVAAFPSLQHDLSEAVRARPELSPLAAELRAQWWGLLPGFHRLAFDEGRVLLTLCVGDRQPMLRAQQFEADSIFLEGFDSRDSPKSIARFACRGTRIASRPLAAAARDALAAQGFKLDETGDGLQGVFDPAWQIRRRAAPSNPTVAEPGHCAVVGAGLAGAAVADSLARRGWRVTVLDAADRPAAGASGLPIGMLAPHVSPDDALLSRLTRAGIRATWQALERLLHEGTDWQGGGVLERRAPGDARLPAGWSAEAPNESRQASIAQLRAAGLPEDAAALWHARAGWVRPARLVAAWLAQPGVRVECNRHVARIQKVGNGWNLLNAGGSVLTEADRIVVAAGYASHPFAPTLPLQPVRGQIAWGRMPSARELPATPINGDGHLIARVPDEGGALWLTGATFDRDRSDIAIDAADTEANLARLARLHPAAAQALSPAFAGGDVEAWAGVRCASGDRRPLVGPLDPADPHGPWVATAMGSRGLTFAALCAVRLAARWHGSRLAVPEGRAGALDMRRL